MEEKATPKHIFHRIHTQESEKAPPDPLDKLVQELQKRNLHRINPISHTVSIIHDEKNEHTQDQDLDILFHLIMQQVHVAAEQEEVLLAGRLVTLENVEKQFGSLLLAQIQTTAARIRFLEGKQARLQSAIERHKGSFFGFLFVGIKSRFQLRSVRTQLHKLYIHHTELTETNKTFQYARRALLQSRKEKAVHLLERMRRERMNHAGTLLLSSMQQWLAKAREQGQFLGFCLEEAGVHASKPPEGFFGLFSHPLASQEREWMEQICHLHGLSPTDTIGDMHNHLTHFIEKKCDDSTYNLANHLLLLMRLLYIREGMCEESNAHVLPLYKLWRQRKEGLEGCDEADDEISDDACQDVQDQDVQDDICQQTWQQAWALSGSSLVNRLSTITSLIKEIELLHQEQAEITGKQVDGIALRNALAKLFRPFVWKTDNLPFVLSKEEKPPLCHLKQWHAKLSQQCDTAFAWWIGQSEKG